MTDVATLDAQELLHLGLYAAQRDEPQQAIECLKRCLELNPQSAPATYMLGALYAQIGLYDRAKLTLARAIELNPTEHTASFQLGLLYLTSGELELARATWSRLDVLPAENFLNLFREGIQALVADEFTRCAELLARGIAANSLNNALNDDMGRLRASAEAAAARPGTILPNAEPASPLSSGSHFLSQYRQQSRQ